MLQFIRCMFGKHASSVVKEYLGFMDLYDMEVCSSCETPVTGERLYERLDRKFGEGKFMKNKGFTLIELLVVIAIIGILASIAIVQFGIYRGRGFDVDVKSNMRNMVVAQEAYFVDTDSYADGTGASQIFLDRGFRLSPNVNIVTTAFPTFFTVDGNAVGGCSPGTGTWTFTSLTGVTAGVQCN